MDVLVDYSWGEDGMDIKSAGLVRTARKIARGEDFVANI